LPTMGCAAAPEPGTLLCQTYPVLRVCCRCAADRWQAKLLRPAARIKSALLYLLAIVAGSLVTGLLYAALKRPEVVELDAVPAGA